MPTHTETHTHTHTKHMPTHIYPKDERCLYIVHWAVCVTVVILVFPTFIMLVTLVATAYLEIVSSKFSIVEMCGAVFTSGRYKSQNYANMIIN